MSDPDFDKVNLELDIYCKEKYIDTNFDFKYLIKVYPKDYGASESAGLRADNPLINEAGRKMKD